MAICLHATTRRELLAASGVLFAWPFLPRLALAEGRDPRFLAIVLRGGLDGLAAVAPVGDPDWVRLRGDKGLAARRQAAGAAARCVLRAQSRDAAPAPAVQGWTGDDRACLSHALSRALAFRRPGRARKRPAAGPAAPIAAGFTARSAGSSRAGRVNPSRQLAPSRSAR